MEAEKSDSTATSYQGSPGMRVWDISPGYLNRESLLGEHRELHGIVSIIINNKKGYANHPETIRWVGYGWAIQQRHKLLSAEMALRSYKENTPVRTRSRIGEWPEAYVDEPFAQLMRLKEKYAGKEQGRIPLPKNCQQLWSHHKYSVLARNQKLYRELGRQIAVFGNDDLPGLAMTLAGLLRVSPSTGDLRNALQHMWGHVSDIPPSEGGKIEKWSSGRLLKEIQKRVMENREPYLMSSTALSELVAWL
jgi:hypothetical protein